MEELIPVVNEKDEVVGVESFSKVHKLGLLHRESYVYLINSDNEVLLQKRQSSGFWDHSAAGHFSKDESYIEGAKREFEEELGVKININELKEISYERLNSIKPNKKNKRFVRIYIIKKDISLDDFNVDDKEVKEVRFFNKSQLQKLLQQPNLFTNSSRRIIEKYIFKYLL
ncbi:NUDIX domain-containing protein [Candidatus Woesearchaeota archaeon]|nr:NUDIX domain-containing protein [Candidatus Woesearchaeota archaeon]